MICDSVWSPGKCEWKQASKDLSRAREFRIALDVDLGTGYDP